MGDKEISNISNTSTAIKELGYIDTITDLLDARFRLPFTNIRFGVDFLIGLVPYAGDVMSFAISGGLVLAMARHGVSTWILIRMLGNVFLDTTIGAIPIIGDLFDLGYRANIRNLDLLKEHYKEEEERGSVWQAVIMVLLVLVVMFVLLIYLIFKLIAWGLAFMGF